jgi:ribosomal protein L14
VSAGSTVSGDGRYVTFTSMAVDLVAGEDDPNGGYIADAFVRDLRTATTTRVSDPAGVISAPAISAHGRYVA